MNFADLEEIWRAPENHPPAAELERHKMKLVAALRRRRRKSLGLLCLVLVPLVIVTVLLVGHILAPSPGHDPVDLQQEWGVVPFFALPWIGWLVLVYLYRRHRRQHLQFAASVQASLVALVDELRMQCNRAKVVGGLLVLSALILIVVVQQLRAVGKAGDEILVPAFVIYPAYVVGMVIWIYVHFRRKILPEKRRLEDLLRSYR